MKILCYVCKRDRTDSEFFTDEDKSLKIVRTSDGDTICIPKVISKPLGKDKSGKIKVDTTCCQEPDDNKEACHSNTYLVVD